MSSGMLSARTADPLERAPFSGDISELMSALQSIAAALGDLELRMKPLFVSKPECADTRMSAPSAPRPPMSSVRAQIQHATSVAAELQTRVNEITQSLDV